MRLLAVALLCAATARAAAQVAVDDPLAPPQELDDAEALRRPFAEARALYDAGKLSEAAVAFGLLYERFPWVGLLYDQAVCLERLGQDAVADRLYREAYERASAPPDRELISARIDRRGTPELRGVVVVWSKPSMRLRLVDGTALGRTPWNGMLEGQATLIFASTGLRDAERRVTLPPRELTTLYYVTLDEPTHGHLSVRTRPSSAQLFLDGEPRGKTPFSADVPLGKHHLVLLREGYAETKRDVVVSKDVLESELDLELVPTKPEPVAPRSAKKIAAPLLLLCGGLLAVGSVSVSQNIGDDGTPATIGTGVMGVAAVAFLAWGVVNLL